MRINTDTERRVEVPWLLARMGSPTRVLDIGAADAIYLDALRKTGAEVHGLDTRPFRAPAGVQTHVCSAADMPGDWFRCFDLVTCISVIDHIGLEAYGQPADPYALIMTLREIERVTATNGRLLITTPAGQDLITTHGRMGGQRVFSLDSLREMFPAHLWRWVDASFWVLRGNDYFPCQWAEIENAGYAGHRAAAAAALELVKR